MSILYSAISQQKNIVGDFESCEGNFLEITQLMLSKIPVRNDKMTYYHGVYLIHYIVEDNYVYLCITDRTCQRSRAFLFLNEIHRNFMKNGKSNLNRTLAEQMYRYNEDYSTIVIRQGELDELNKIGVESSESILGEKVLFVNNTENLSYATVTFVGKTPEVPEVLRISDKPVRLENPDQPVNACSDKLDSPEIIDNPDKAKMQVFYVIIIGLLMFILSAMYILGPASFVVVVGVVAVTIKKFHSDNAKEKSD